MKYTYILASILLIIAILLPIYLISSQEDTKILYDEEFYFTALCEGEIINTNMADWLISVLAAEMPASFELEALKAQAVAARTYIINKYQNGTINENHPSALVCDDYNCCQAYISLEDLKLSWGDNFDSYLDKIKLAISSTDGEVLFYENEAIEAVFHSSSYGYTESSEAIWSDRAYLVSVESPETTEDVANLESTVILSTDEFREILENSDYNFIISDNSDTWLGEMTLEDSGRCDTLTICGINLTGNEIRSLFSLRSTDFTVTYSDNCFTFEVLGYGHGVGMSQYGANIMAKAGSSYTEILYHYYTGTHLDYFLA